MSLDSYKLFAALLILISSGLAVIYPLKSRSLPKHNTALELGDAFASGIFLGVALFHMLPEAIHGFAWLYPNINYPLAELFCAAGFMLLLFFERLSHRHSSDQHCRFSYVIAIIIIVHSLIEGAALGINTSIATAAFIFLAIIAHKGSESFALAVILNKSNLPYKIILGLIAIFALSTPLGIAFGATLSSYLKIKTGLLLAASFNAFAAGTFLYMSTLHHLNHHHHTHEDESLQEYFFVVAGLSTMAVVAYWS